MRNDLIEPADPQKLRNSLRDDLPDDLIIVPKKPSRITPKKLFDRLCKAVVRLLGKPKPGRERRLHH